MMIYTDDPSDVWCVGPKFGRWLGDCEDYAFTKQREIGGDVWHVVLPDGRHHAALVRDGFVYDNLHKSPVKLSSYQASWLFIMRPIPTVTCPSAPFLS